MQRQCLREEENVDVENQKKDKEIINSISKFISEPIEGVLTINERSYQIFQNEKLPLVDEAIELDKEIRASKQECEALRASRNDLSKQIGAFMKDKEIEKANEIKAIVSKNNERIAELEPQINEKSEKHT